MMYSRTYASAVVKRRAALSNSRLVQYKFSDSSVARDGNTISNTGWDLTAFKANPIFLWAHDASSPPIGKVIDVVANQSGLFGSVEYATADQYPFADTVYQLVLGGFLNAVSVCWNALEFRYSQDRTRPGGIDFIKQELWEVSQVPLPALADALATARSRGINTSPLFVWAEKLLDKGDFKVASRKNLEDLRRQAGKPPTGRTAFASAESVAGRVARAKQIKARVTALIARSIEAEAQIAELQASHLQH